MSEIGQKIIAGIRKLAEEQPDFRYRPPDGDTCVYVHDGEGSCGVGRVLLDLGLITTELECDRRRVNGSRVNEAAASDLLVYLGIIIDSPERDWINRYQIAQDDEQPWGRAVQLADHAFPLTVVTL